MIHKSFSFNMTYHAFGRCTVVPTIGNPHHESSVNTIRGAGALLTLLVLGVIMGKRSRNPMEGRIWNIWNGAVAWMGWLQFYNDSLAKKTSANFMGLSLFVDRSPISRPTTEARNKRFSQIMNLVEFCLVSSHHKCWDLTTNIFHTKMV